MDCQHLDELYELYLLGGLDARTAADLDAHLHGECARCFHGMREAAETVYWLIQGCQPARPRAAVRSRLAERLAAPLPVRGTAAAKARVSPSAH